MTFKPKEVDQLLAETGRRCCLCGGLHKVQVHHIVSKEDGGSDEIDNAIPLCPNCHDEVHAGYASGRTTRAYTAKELKLHRKRTAIGSFLSKLCIPSDEEVGVMLRDRISVHRLKNLARVIEEAEILIEAKQETITGELDIRALQVITENASLVEEETLQTMWAGLLAGGAIEDGSTDDILLYADILRGLTVFQGRMLNLIYGDKRIADVTSAARPSDFGSIEKTFEHEKRTVVSMAEVISLHPDLMVEQLKTTTFERRFVSGDEVNAKRGCCPRLTTSGWCWIRPFQLTLAGRPRLR